MNDIMIQVCMRESQLERNFAVSIVLAVPAFHMIAAIRAQAWYLIRWVYAGFGVPQRVEDRGADSRVSITVS